MPPDKPEGRHEGEKTLIIGDGFRALLTANVSIKRFKKADFKELQQDTND